MLAKQTKISRLLQNSRARESLQICSANLTDNGSESNKHYFNFLFKLGIVIDERKTYVYSICSAVIFFHISTIKWYETMLVDVLMETRLGRWVVIPKISIANHRWRKHVAIRRESCRTLVKIFSTGFLEYRIAACESFRQGWSIKK